MKNTILSLAILIITLGTIQAQEARSLPNTEFSLDLSETALNINTGESASIELGILRSKAYKKSNASLGLSSTLPEGVQVTFEPANGVIENTTVRITASASTKPGEYLLILKATLQNRTKGATLKLTVVDSETKATTSGR
jgi:hypothetical protein